MKTKVKWAMFGDSEWIHFGTDNDMNLGLVVKNIDSFFEDNDLYIATTKTEAFKINKSQVNKSKL
jgi:hypothetical protein